MRDATLKKPNATLVMMPKVGKLTAIERKLLNSILVLSAQQLSAYRSLHGQDPSNTHFYFALASELLKPIEAGKSNLKSALRKHVLALRRAEIDWEAPDAKSGTVWSNLSVLSQAKFDIRNGSLYVLWALPPEINKALSDSQGFPFTKLDLEKISLLKSYTAVALYEICARYRNNYLKGGNGECLTSSNSPEWWVDALTNIVPKLNDETGQPIRREWRKVKNEVVKKAIQEINSSTDLDIELREKKEGKAIKLVQFVVRQKKLEPQQIQSSHFDLIKIGVRLGLSQIQIESGINQTSAEQVSLTLAKLEARINQGDLDPVENVNSYFNSMLKKAAPIKLVSDAEIKQNSDSLTPPLERQTEQAKSPQTLAKEEFMLLPESIKKEYAVRALAVLFAKGISTPRIQQNAESGVWSGVLLSQMIEIFREDSSKT